MQRRDAEESEDRGHGHDGTGEDGARLVSVESGLISWTRSLTQSRVVGSRSEASSVLSLVARNIASDFPDKNGETKATTSTQDKKPTKK